MLDEKKFKVLSYMAESRNSSQRMIAEATGLSVGTVNSVIKALRKSGSIEDDSITKKGYEDLAPYRVDNAIILAAGMATRFVPVSYEIPKGLIKVKGEPLIERLIHQLRSVGINEIVVVVGYMMEKFLYLRDKYNVKFVVNNEFADKNTHSSIYAARDYMKKTLIICADNYYPNNLFKKYEFHSYYCAVFLPGVGYTERSLVTDAKGLVIDTHKPSNDEWIMIGHSYWDNSFSEAFRPIIENYYGRPGIENYYWETIWSENLNKCPMWIKRCTKEEILEFDSVRDLAEYDKNYILENETSIMQNICSVLLCKPNDVEDFQAIKTGLNNKSFSFMCKGQKYVYRHPGKNADGVIDRQKEAFAQRCANTLGIDKTLVHIDEKVGWKISKFVYVTDKFDFSNKVHVSALAKHLRRLHMENITCGTAFSYMNEADKLISVICQEDYDSGIKVIENKSLIEPIFVSLQKDNWQVSLCHNDIYEPNLLVSEDRVNLIDWEFAGDTDIGYDICKLFACLDLDYEAFDDYLCFYYGRPTSTEEIRHLIGCAAILYFYWFVWGVYASKNGTAVSDYMIKWYDKMVKYSNMYKKKLVRKEDS